jgi:hypothetical protein
MFALEGDGENSLRLFLQTWQPRFQFKRLILTIRMTDWWYWEWDHPLEISRILPSFSRLPDTLDEFTLDLEVRNGKKNELHALVEKRDVENWVFQTDQTPHSADETTSPLASQEVFRFVSKSSSSWVGPSKINGQPYAHHTPSINKTPELSPDDMLYYILTLKWRKC